MLQNQIHLNFHYHGVVYELKTPLWSPVCHVAIIEWLVQLMRFCKSGRNPKSLNGFSWLDDWVRWEYVVTPCKGIRIPEWRKFEFWNPECKPLESRIQNKESGILLTIQVPQVKKLESSSWNPESTGGIQNPRLTCIPLHGPNLKF